MDCKEWKNQHFKNEANANGTESAEDAFMYDYFDDENGAAYGEDGYYRPSTDRTGD